MSANNKKLSRLDVLLSLPTDPSGMLNHLLYERKTPPYILTAPIVTLLVLVAPTIYFQYYLQMSPVRPEIAGSISVATAVTIGSFCFFMTALLRILMLPVTGIKVLAAIFYSLAVLIPFMLAFYLANFIVSGELSILSYLSSGRYKEEDWIIGLFPNCARMSLFVSLLIFMNAIKALGNCTTISALALTLFSIPVIIGAFAVGITVANGIFPDTGALVYQFFVSLVSP